MTAGVVEARFAPDLRRCPDNERDAGLVLVAPLVTRVRAYSREVPVGIVVAGQRVSPKGRRGRRCGP
jgi:hypothetical protein